MRVKKFRYFIDAVIGQEKWLNKIASKGYRLIGVSNLTYCFESCNPNEFKYHVELISDKSYKESKDYKLFIEEFGYKTFYKNLNLNYSLLKFRFRPWAKGAGKFATNPGLYNKELLILEKKNDGKPFNLHTDTQDTINYYTRIRNMYLCPIILFAISLFPKSNSNSKYFALILIFIFLVPFIEYSKIVYKYKKSKKLYE
ncbi:DUF2812 domain-containing protein [Clostridium botulinum]|uniref:DUF2812 domain-containing protein n=2 Tax=Clostridium botulinum TaxID=1491 RepID=C1FQA8_CLOBJ|nr:DUF2812 domain-containing protein [Clostridium botulinum]EKN42315.1 hypothetical protein CFSAN001627_07587 [Clostridium botulinum CFSAN001627]ACO83935.1 conserved hypothetical protein [Clostridium botulinum A2 str. Kyoto]APC80127.1 hypothetical protein NPD2_594 [Clostridium botulinum]APC84718.1 hypothetical protein NPD12_2234 [Clostridium botulinum]AUN07233.1 hypothetical protein RSJ14_11200 [Clostridium botulinum]